VWQSPSRLAGLALFAALAGAPAGASEADELRVGFAATALPAPDGGPLAGYGGLRDRKASGMADPPEARALVLERGEQRIAIVTLDVVLVRPALRDALLEPVRALDVDALLLVATHTHSGPGGYMRGFLAERFTSGSFVPDALDALADAALDALTRAVATLAPARAASASGELELAANRSFDDGARETALPVLRLDRDGEPPVLVFAYGMHPTVRSRASRVYSADYVGDARRALAERGWTPLYLPGPLGDQGPTSALGPLDSGDPALEARQSAEAGGALAAAVHALAAEMRPTPNAPLAALERWSEAPPLRLRRFCSLWWIGPFVRGSLSRFVSPRVPIHALRIGQVRLLALPAEPSAELGRELRARVAPGALPLVVAHANDWLGYALTREEYRRGSYEACLSFHGPGFGEWLVENAAAALLALEERDGG
jgi:hypothetical protein